MALTIELRPDLEEWLTQEAARRGQQVPELARALLETTIRDATRRSHEPLLPGGVAARSPAELFVLARRQGVTLPAPGALQVAAGAVADAEFDVDAFLQARRAWQGEDDPGFPFDESHDDLDQDPQK